MGYRIIWNVSIERFWKRVKKTRSCWLWTGKPMKSGYGYFFNGHHTSAHRFSWMLHHKKAPGAGWFVCHKCDVKLCVNPDHLFLARHKQNLFDMIKKDRQFKKVSIADARAIRALYATGRFNGEEIGKLFSIGKDYTNTIIRGDSRPELDVAAKRLGLKYTPKPKS